MMIIDLVGTRFYNDPLKFHWYSRNNRGVANFFWNSLIPDTLDEWRHQWLTQGGGGSKKENVVILEKNKLSGSNEE